MGSSATGKCQTTAAAAYCPPLGTFLWTSPLVMMAASAALMARRKAWAMTVPAMPDVLPRRNSVTVSMPSLTAVKSSEGSNMESEVRGSRMTKHEYE